MKAKVNSKSRSGLETIILSSSSLWLIVFHVVAYCSTWTAAILWVSSFFNLIQSRSLQYSWLSKIGLDSLNTLLSFTGPIFGYTYPCKQGNKPGPATEERLEHSEDKYRHCCIKMGRVDSAVQFVQNISSLL